MDLQRLRARDLRNNPTLAENKLWQRIRSSQLGVKFRRQAPLGPYVLDFFCPVLRLVIEIDGGQHAADPSDLQRDAWLRSQGLHVLRFWNHEVMGNLDGVLERIRLETAKEDPP